MKKALLLIMFPILILNIGCSKDQKVVRQLEGEWKTTSLTSDDKPVDKSEYENFTYQFNKCKVSKGDCDGYLKTIYNGIPFSLLFKYNISENGKKISINLNNENETINEIIKTMAGTEDGTINATILENSKKKFIYSYEATLQDENGKSEVHHYVTTMEKL